MSTTTTTSFDLGLLKQAIEERDASTQLAMYAQDAEVTLIDKLATPSSPRVLHGRAEIESWLADVCGRDMTHRVQQTVRDADGAAFIEACRYPDGTAVTCATVLELSAGRVARQVVVQAWDD